MKRNNLDASKLMYGVSYGDHIMNPEGIVKELESLLVGTANAFLVRLWRNAPLSEEAYLEIARFAVKQNMPFGFLYATQHAPEGEISHISPELCQKIKAIGGELFLGEVYGESGSEVGAKDKGYFTENRRPNHAPMPPQDTQTMTQAAKDYTDHLEHLTAYSKSLGMNTMIVEATALSRYALAAGIDVPILEACPGNVERLVPFTRGAAIGYGKKLWGSFIAHEWYAGYNHADALKKKRLELFYKYLYLSGSNIIFLESGSTELQSFGEEHGYDSPLCQNYRRVMKENFDYMSANKRPANGPLTNVAFIMGEGDGFTDFMGGSAWCRFDREEWGKSASERSWDILKSVYRSGDWHDAHTYANGGLDLSGAPGYGSYDILPAETPPEQLQSYDYLVFLGWNTMSGALYEKLTAYVKNGGNLLMSVAHLNENANRKTTVELVNSGDVTELFGCRITGATRYNHGVKFDNKSYIPEMQYPGTPNKVCDPVYPEGFADYARVELTTGTVRAELVDRFSAPAGDSVPVVIENKCGKGTAILTTHMAYPGDPAVMPIYTRLVKALLAASHAKAEVKVTGADKVRFSVFEEKGKYTVYLLNTDFDTPACVSIHYADNKREVMLPALGFQKVEL